MANKGKVATKKQRVKTLEVKCGWSVSRAPTEDSELLPLATVIGETLGRQSGERPESDLPISMRKRGILSHRNRDKKLHTEGTQSHFTIKG